MRWYMRTILLIQITHICMNNSMDRNYIRNYLQNIHHILEFLKNVYFISTFDGHKRNLKYTKYQQEIKNIKLKQSIFYPASYFIFCIFELCIFEILTQGHMNNIKCTKSPRKIKNNNLKQSVLSSSYHFIFCIFELCIFN